VPSYGLDAKNKRATRMLIDLLAGGALLFVFGIVGSLRHRKFVWLPFAGGLVLIAVAVGLGLLLPRVLYP
jgi:hypothetical protein